MELLTLEKIAEIALYKKGRFIDSPKTEYYIGYISIDSKIKIVKITRRSLMHIIEKGGVGIKLAVYLRELLFKPLVITKNFKFNNRFFIISSLEHKNAGIIIEINRRVAFIVTAMIVDSDYLKKHFPEVSIE